MKRFTFITLGVISLILPVIYGTIKYDGCENIIPFSLLTYMVYIPISIVWVLGYGLIISGEVVTPGDDVPIFFSVFTLGRKKIYYSDLGYFYMSIKKDGSMVSIHKQGIFVSHKLFEIYYNNDVEELRSSIKAHLDSIYREKLEKKKIKDRLKQWDGYIDTTSKRDDKLNQLLK